MSAVIRVAEDLDQLVDARPVLREDAALEVPLLVLRIALGDLHLVGVVEHLQRVAEAGDGPLVDLLEVRQAFLARRVVLVQRRIQVEEQGVLRQPQRVDAGVGVVQLGLDRPHLGRDVARSRARWCGRSCAGRCSGHPRGAGWRWPPPSRSRRPCPARRAQSATPQARRLHPGTCLGVALIGAVHVGVHVRLALGVGVVLAVGQVGDLRAHLGLGGRRNGEAALVVVVHHHRRAGHG